MDFRTVFTELEAASAAGVITRYALGGAVAATFFEPELDERRFAAFRVEGGVLDWPNGASLAPEFPHGRRLCSAHAELRFPNRRAH
jgi:hypothetical protein